MVTLKAHILPHHDLQPPGCRGSVAGISELLKNVSQDTPKVDMKQAQQYLS